MVLSVAAMPLRLSSTNKDGSAAAFNRIFLIINRLLSGEKRHARSGDQRSKPSGQTADPLSEEGRTKQTRGERLPRPTPHLEVSNMKSRLIRR